MAMIVLHIDTEHDTSVMKALYDGLENVTLLYNPTRVEFEEVMESNPTADFMCVGHGNAYGLFNVDLGGYIIDGANADLLRNRERVVCIWCWAVDFGRRNKIRGFFTSMFISNPMEASWFGYDKLPVEVYDQQNLWLCDEVRTMLNENKAIDTWVNALQEKSNKTLDFVRFNYDKIAYLNP